MTLESLEKSIVWKKSYTLTLNIYRTINTFPSNEEYGLKSQIRRSSVSIPSNIAEGLLRSSKKEFSHFSSIARGSAGELMTQIMLSEDLGYISKEKASEIKQELSEIIRILYAIIKTIRNHS